MTQEDYRHPIAPPPELVRQWCAEADNQLIGPYYDHIATRAAQWGYQQAVEELEAFLRKGHDKG